MTPLPEQYVVTIRRLVRFAMISLSIGLLLGVYSTQMNRVLRYGDVPRKITAEERARGATHEVQLPPGLMWEAGIDLRLSHGHVILIGAVVPLCIAAALGLIHHMGAPPIGAGTLSAFFWLYFVGGIAAMALIIYKGMCLFAAVRAEEFDLAKVHETMFGGKLVKGLAYGISHTVLAAGVGVIAVALWKATAARPKA